MDNRVGCITAQDLQNLLVVVEEKVAGSSLGGQRRHKFPYVCLMGHWGETAQQRIIRKAFFDLLRVALTLALPQQRGGGAQRAGRLPSVAAAAVCCVAVRSKLPVGVSCCCTRVRVALGLVDP